MRYNTVWKGATTELHTNTTDLTQSKKRIYAARAVAHKFNLEYLTSPSDRKFWELLADDYRKCAASLDNLGFNLALCDVELPKVK